LAQILSPDDPKGLWKGNHGKIESSRTDKNIQESPLLRRPEKVTGRTPKTPPNAEFGLSELKEEEIER
jgi:tRNA G37 N-methylase TrmD